MSDQPATAASMQNVLREGTDGTAEPPARVSAAGQFQRDHERDMADPEYAEAFREATDEVTTTAAREPWTRHAWDDSHKYCVECHQEWPCDIAKAWRGGYEWAETKQRLRELHEQFVQRETVTVPLDGH